MKVSDVLQLLVDLNVDYSVLEIELVSVEKLDVLVEHYGSQN